MKLTNILNFNTIDEFVSWKLEEFAKTDKSYGALFEYMFSEKENVMCESSDGYRIKKLTYGDCKNQITKRAKALKASLDLPINSTVAIYMENSIDWIQMFWSVLMCGYNPLLLNLRLSKSILEKVLFDYDVKAVISDGEEFAVKTIVASDVKEMDGESCFDTWGREVFFMSSGTTDNLKLCAYTAENFYYQVGNSVDIVKKCPQIASHYNGEIKLLTLLPFYHVFGFIAVYLWFGFFSRTFVFVKDLNPKTIQNTIKKHKVTHFFAVPLVWEAVYKASIRTIKNRGEKTYKKFLKGLKIINDGKLGKKLAMKSMSTVRDGLFGESIQFLISGGGFISKQALEFFNGIGYHLANGYGMTEVGITSVDISKLPKQLNKGSIGVPFKYTEYSVDENNTLLIKGKNMASRILQDKKERVTDYSKWFCSQDIAFLKDGQYYLGGRNDDLIIPASGENINPQLVEQQLSIAGAEEICLFSSGSDVILLIHSSKCYSANKIKEIIDSAKLEIEKANLQTVVNKVLITPDNFLTANDFKLSRKKLKSRYESGELTLIDNSTVTEKIVSIHGELEKQIKQIFASVLSKSETEINITSNFFADLGGSSLEYFMLSDAILSKYGVDIKLANGKSLSTVDEICTFIKSN